MERLTIAAGERLDILAVGAHADDIEIGAGGTILRMLAEHPGSRITWVIATGICRPEPPRHGPARPRSQPTRRPQGHRGRSAGWPAAGPTVSVQGAARSDQGQGAGPRHRSLHPRMPIRIIARSRRSFGRPSVIILFGSTRSPSTTATSGALTCSWHSTRRQSRARSS